MLKELFQELGKIAVPEAYVGGKNIDLLVQDIKTKEIQAIEIQLTSKHVIENVEKDLRSCHKVVLLFEKPKLMQEAKDKIAKYSYNGKVEFYLLEEYIDYFIPLIPIKKQLEILRYKIGI
jgi:hypothetical protein